ncbi:hypothetical protein [Arcanobacterium canis]
MNLLNNPLIGTILTGVGALFFLTFAIGGLPSTTSHKPAKNRQRKQRPNISREVKWFFFIGFLLTLATIAGILEIIFG